MKKKTITDITPDAIIIIVLTTLYMSNIRSNVSKIKSMICVCVVLLIPLQLRKKYIISLQSVEPINNS